MRYKSLLTTSGTRIASPTMAGDGRAKKTDKVLRDEFGAGSVGIVTFLCGKFYSQITNNKWVPVF